MLDTSVTVAAILESSTEIQSALLRMAAEMRAQAWQTVWTAAPMWLRVLLAALLIISAAERAYRTYRRWRHVVL